MTLSTIFQELKENLLRIVLLNIVKSYRPHIHAVPGFIPEPLVLLNFLLLQIWSHMSLQFISHIIPGSIQYDFFLSFMELFEYESDHVILVQVLKPNRLLLNSSINRIDSFLLRMFLGPINIPLFQVELVLLSLLLNNLSVILSGWVKSLLLHKGSVVLLLLRVISPYFGLLHIVHHKVCSVDSGSPAEFKEVFFLLV